MADTINVGKNAVDVRKSEKQLPYSKVIVNVASVDDNTVISYEAGDDSGTTMEIDCPWGSQAMANNLLNLVRGYEYQPYTTTTAIVNPAAEMGDAVQSNGVFGGIYQQDAEFGHTFYNDFSAPQDEQLDHEFTFESTIERRLSRQETHTKATFQIQHENISACVTKENGFAVDNSFSWKLLSDHFELNAGTKNVFNCNKDGIQVDGEIRARTGYIGTNANGFVIDNKNIYNGMIAYNDTAHNGVYLGTDGIGLGAGKFYVTSSGSLVAKDATLTGTITAKGGRIGADSSGNNGFEITTNAIKNGKSSYSDANAGVYLGTSGIGLGAGKFYVTSVGKLYASDVEIEGKVTATSGSFKGNITCDSITFSTGVTIDGSNITDGTISGGKIGNGEIGDSKISDVGGSKVGSGINGGNINGSSIGGDSLKDSTVPKGKTNFGGQVDNGQTAYNYTSDISGDSVKDRSVRAKTGQFTNCTIGTATIPTATVGTLKLDDGNSSYTVKWKSITIDGTSYTLLGR